MRLSRYATTFWAVSTLENYWQVYGAVYLEGSVNVDLEPVTRYGFSKVARRQACASNPCP